MESGLAASAWDTHNGGNSNVRGCPGPGSHGAYCGFGAASSGANACWTVTFVVRNQNLVPEPVPFFEEAMWLLRNPAGSGGGTRGRLYVARIARRIYSAALGQAGCLSHVDARCLRQAFQDLPDSKSLPRLTALDTQAGRTPPRVFAPVPPYLGVTMAPCCTRSRA